MVAYGFLEYKKYIVYRKQNAIKIAERYKTVSFKIRMQILSILVVSQNLEDLNDFIIYGKCSATQLL